MRVKLICGFLGAGKTTLVKNLLKAKGNYGKIAVLVNDFGNVGIDGEIIGQAGSVRVLELPSGCICCSLRADLSSGITDIYRRFKPEILIIEPTGIATPSAILQTLREHELKHKMEIEPVVGIIDPTTFFDFVEDFSGFFMDQIVNSDFLLINKMDLVSLEIGDQIEKKLRELNPSAIIYRTTYCRAELPTGTMDRKEEKFIFENSFESFAYRTEKKFVAEEVEKFFSSFSGDSYGRIIRAKGIFRCDEGGFLIDYTPSNLVVERCSSTSESKVMFIGSDLNKSKLRSDLQVLEKSGSEGK